MFRLDLIWTSLLISSVFSSRLKYRSSVKENVDLYYTITSLDQMLAVNYHQSIEFLNINAPYTTYFLVDGQKLRTSRLIDREEFCRIQLCDHSRCHPCEIEMDFVLKENGQSKDILSLILTIEDVNEFPPQFVHSLSKEQTIQLNISEGVPVGHILPVPSATDKDGDDEELIYWLEKKKTIPFDLISFGSNQIALNVTESLDRESDDFYELRLNVADRGNLTTTISLQIFVTDINDNVPVFDRASPYHLKISENTLPSLSQSLLRLRAIDDDINDNGRVTFQFTGQVSESIRQRFQLNSLTGDLYLLRPLDYEQTKEYRIQITAQDSGPVSVPVYTVILITVEDENDNKPSVTLRISEYFQYRHHVLYISEETPLNTLLMHILIEDLDSGLNGRVRCWIESIDNLQFNITNTIDQMFALYTGQLFDREKQSNYSLRLFVEDRGEKIRHRTSRDFQLFITDINDCSPKFSQEIFHLSVQEEEDYRSALIQFQAIDDDLNENGQISYELLNKEFQSFFYLNEKTGQFYLRQRLNRERQSKFNLTIRARDHGIYPRSLFSDVQLVIFVLDKNEFQPIFDQIFYRFDRIAENFPVNASIGFIRASDGDEHSIFYSISSSEEFLIDPLTGEIRVLTPLDYDNNPTCRHFLGIAEDQHGANTTCQIEICLQPVNEYPPELRLESRRVPINVDNTTFIQIEAFDRDYSPNSFLSYHFEQSSLCNLTFGSNGTIYLPNDPFCRGVLDLSFSISDNDRSPSIRTINETIRFVFYSSKEMMLQKQVKRAGEILTIFIVVLLIVMIICVVWTFIYRQEKKCSIVKGTSLKDPLRFPEKHVLLHDAVNIKLPSTLNSETSSSYHDSCYGSSDVDLPSQYTGKVLLANNENFLIFSKEHSRSHESSSPVDLSNNFITRYQRNKRTGMAQLESSTKPCEFLHNDQDYRKLPTSFQCRTIPSVHEYYL